MKIAITTPSGHVGSAVTDFLLDFGGDIHVKLLARRPKNLENFVKRGAELCIGSQDDSNFLVSATRDVDALFWVTPPGFGSDDLRAFQNRIGKAGAFAIRTNKISRVVNLSSIGAHLSSGVGPINGLYDVEGLLDEVCRQHYALAAGVLLRELARATGLDQEMGKNFAAGFRCANISDDCHARYRSSGGRATG